MARPGYYSHSTNDSSATMNSSPLLWFIVLPVVITIIGVGAGTYVGVLHFQNSMISRLDKLDHGLEDVLKKIASIEVQLATLKTAEFDKIGFRGDDQIEYTSKYRPLPPDFEMFAIGFIIVCFIVMFMVYKGDINRGH